jgi:hypothetical protein
LNVVLNQRFVSMFGADPPSVVGSSSTAASMNSAHPSMSANPGSVSLRSA